MQAPAAWARTPPPSTTTAPVCVALAGVLLAYGEKIRSRLIFYRGADPLATALSANAPVVLAVVLAVTVVAAGIENVRRGHRNADQPHVNYDMLNNNN